MDQKAKNKRNQRKMVEERVCWANSLICSNHDLERWKHRGRSSNMAISWEISVTTWRFQCENHWRKSRCSVAMYDYQRGNNKTSIVPPLLQLILFPGLSSSPWSTGPSLPTRLHQGTCPSRRYTSFQRRQSECKFPGRNMCRTWAIPRSSSPRSNMVKRSILYTWTWSLLGNTQNTVLT